MLTPELPNTLFAITAATTDAVTTATTEGYADDLKPTSPEIAALISAINALTTNVTLLDSGIQQAINLCEEITNQMVAPQKRRRRRGPSRKKNSARKTRRKVR